MPYARTQRRRSRSDAEILWLHHRHKAVSIYAALYAGQESLVFVQPQWNFKKLIRAYERAEQDGYYAVAGAEPRSVVVLKQPIGELPAGARLLWVCGDRVSVGR